MSTKRCEPYIIAKLIVHSIYYSPLCEVFAQWEEADIQLQIQHWKIPHLNLFENSMKPDIYSIKNSYLSFVNQVID